jgi:pyrroline-5-carboxylate reductase
LTLSRCWFFSLYGELINATKSADLPAHVSAKLVMGMAKGAAEFALMKADQSPVDIAEGIATEGTFSKMGLDVLKQADAFSSWTEACTLLKKQLAGIDKKI